MKKVFTNPLCQWLFKWLHPDLGMKLAGYFSYKSRYANGTVPMESFQGEDKEWLIQYCKRKLESKPITISSSGIDIYLSTLNLTMSAVTLTPVIG
jgi:UDP-2,3-diacylglucosamine hydrolase